MTLNATYDSHRLPSEESVQHGDLYACTVQGAVADVKQDVDCSYFLILQFAVSFHV